MCVCVSISVVSDSLWPRGLYPARLLCPQDVSSCPQDGVGSHFLLQGIFPTQGWTWVSCMAGRFFTFWAIGLTNSTLFGSEWFQWVYRLANTVKRKEEREGEGGGREMKETVKGMHSMILEKQKENSSTSRHEHRAAFCIHVFYKPFSILFKICNRKWDLHPLKLVWRNKCFFLWQLLLGPIIGTGGKW